MVRLDGIEKRKLDKHFYPQGAYTNCVFVCDFKTGRMRKFPLWHWPPLLFMFHIVYMTLLQTQTQAHKCTDAHSHVTKSLAAALSTCRWLPQNPGWVAWHRHSIPESLQAALTQAAHHCSLHSQVKGRWSCYDEKEGVEDPRPIVEVEKYPPHLLQWPLRPTGYNTHKNASTCT